MRQKEAQHWDSSIEGQVSLLESCENDAQKGLVSEVGLDEDRALSRNQEKKAILKASWIRQGPDREQTSPGLKEKGKSGHWNPDKGA